MAPLSSNDWPALSSGQLKGPPQPQQKGTTEQPSTVNYSKSTSTATSWQARPLHNGSLADGPILPPHTTRTTTMLAPPPGLRSQFNHASSQNIESQQHYQPMYYYHAAAQPVIMTSTPSNINGNLYTPSFPLKYTPFNGHQYGHYYSHQYHLAPNGHPRVPLPHGSIPPRPPPGLLPARVGPMQNGASSTQTVLSSTLRSVSSPNGTSSSLSGKDRHTATLSPPSSTSSPPILSNLREEVTLLANEKPMDKYAATYVPSWLRDVNDETQFTHVPLPEEPNYDYDAFVSGFLPRSLIFSDPDEEVGVAVQKKDAEKDITSTEQEIDLIKVDSSWLKGDSDDLLEDLEASQEGFTQEQEDPPSSTHASVGALSQTQDGDPDLTALQSSPVSTVQQSVSDIRLKVPLPPFTPATYSDRFTKLLGLEYTHRRDMLAAQSLFDVRLSVFPENSTQLWSQDHLYSLRLPGVREDYPNLVTGDLLQLRVLASHSDTWLRIAFEAKVYVVHKVAGIVIIKCDALAKHLEKLFTGIQAARFNVLFTSSAFRGGIETISGVERVGKYLNRPDNTTRRVLRRWLFPSLSDEEASRDASRVHKPIKWYDENLNAEQKGIARAITSSSLRKIPFLIHGPPGTGKTKSLVETTLQILQHDYEPHILLTAPSVTAADTLAMRLAKHLNPREMTRINDPRRTFEEVPEALLIYCTIEESSSGSARFGLPEWDKLIKSKVVIMATQDIHILHLCKVSNLELGRWQGVTISSMLGKSFGSAKLHWTHLLVDEAGQSSEAEIANALLLVAPSMYHDVDTCLPIIILCGDIAQLGPQIDSHFARSHGLDVSLLERLSRRKVYHRQLSNLRSQARQTLLRGDFGSESIGKEEEGEERVTSGSAAHLVRNYRARNASLLHVVSMLFYDDCLLPCAPHSNLDLSLWPFPNNKLPILFQHIDSKDEWVDEGASFYNAEEINKVVELCKSLTSNGTGFVSAKDIAVITPYREQVWRIRLKLRKMGLAGVSVGNVEVYQGAEHKITILSTVRSSTRFLEIDAKRSLGLVYERKRLCVALSRAQEALFVVGNANLLQMDPYWRSFIYYANRNAALKGQLIPLNDEDASQQVGALEYAARIDALPNEKDTAYLAGRMAASALYEEEEDEEEEEEEEEEGKNGVGE